MGRIGIKIAMPCGLPHVVFRGDRRLEGHLTGCRGNQRDRGLMVWKSRQGMGE
ncbi:uncharacterized protein GLRG_00066 [Colletotrichum graminicola M1.001]|uniref:Uncharacterized protein n=1 Tax=Colletotrichum graminicola (strain M1.001 / M2 / FGSC 10212) TaxID=645133 RepID=E3Q2U3_COLGM|nr:uncharacterized protein GLRG_00066 [Colletotrichum graminicola M1.001]EFQ24922.1 hypothetical protein GLRG_00066 [Colletotrichum graminicola M1.001]